MSWLLVVSPSNYVHSKVSFVKYSHDDAVFVVLVTTLLYLAVSRRGNIHRYALATDGSLNDSYSLFGSFVSSISSLDIPDVGLQNIAAAANAHLSEVAHSILGLDETYEQ